MKVKIDTKEKFHVFTPGDAVLSANMTEEFREKLLAYLETDIKNIILNLKLVNKLEAAVTKEIIDIQEHFKNKNASFVICEMQAHVGDIFKQQQLLEQLNVTRTESEARDIVQMEEIERELE